MEALAINGRSYISELAKNARVSMRGLKLAMPRLIEERMVTPAGEEQGKKYFAITTFGLFFVFYYQEPRMFEITDKPPTRPKELAVPLWHSIKDVSAVNGGKVPLVLGKWSFFKSKRIDLQILNRLCDFFVSEELSSLLAWQAHIGLPLITVFAPLANKSSNEEWQKYTQQARGLSKSNIVNFDRYSVKVWNSTEFEAYEIMLVENLTRYVLFPSPAPLISDKKTDWRLVLRKDPDIKKYLKQEIAERESHYEEELIKLLQWKTALETI